METKTTLSSKKPFGKNKDKNFRLHPEKIKHFKKKSASSETINKTDEIRLNKYISNSGICSRREADKYIKTGSTSVNGKLLPKWVLR